MFSLENRTTCDRPTAIPRMAQISRASSGCAEPLKTSKRSFIAPHHATSSHDKYVTLAGRCNRNSTHNEAPPQPNRLAADCADYADGPNVRGIGVFGGRNVRAIRVIRAIRGLENEG